MRTRIFWSVGLLAPGVCYAGGYETATPANAWAFFGCDDVKKTRADFEASGFGRMIFDPSMEAARQEVQKALEGFRANMTETAGADPLEILEWVDGAAGLVVFDCASADPTFFVTGASMPRVGLMLGGGERAPTIEARVRELLDPEIKAGRGSMETRDVEGVSVTVVREIKQADDLGQDPNGEIAFCVVDGTFVLTLQPEMEGDPEEIDDLIRGLKGSLEATLAESSTYTESLAATGPDGSGVRAFVDVGRIVRQALASLADSASPDDGASITIARALGVEQFGALGARMVQDASGWDGSLQVRLEGDTALGSILARMFPAGALHTLGRITPAAARAGSGHLDLAAGLDAILAFLDEANPEAASEARMGLAMASTPDFDLRRDLLDPLGDEIGFVYSSVSDDLEALPGTEDDPKNFALLIELDGADVFEPMLERLIEEQGMAAVREKSDFEGRMVSTVPTPFGVKVHFSFLADMLVLSGSEELLKDVLRRVGQHELPTLATDASFASNLEEAGPGPWTSVSATDVADDLASNISMLSEALGAAGLNSGTIPSIDRDAAAKFVSGRALSVVQLGSDGVLLRTLYRAPQR